MIPPPKKTAEQLQREREILRDGFKSPFWAILKDRLQREMNDRYRTVMSVDTIEHLKRTQGEILGLEYVLNQEVEIARWNSGG